MARGASSREKTSKANRHRSRPPKAPDSDTVRIANAPNKAAQACEGEGGEVRSYRPAASVWA